MQSKASMSMSAHNKLNSYKKWITDDPKRASEFETIVKWGSYFFAGRLSNSSLLYEIIYSGSKLLEMYNDFLLCGKFPVLTTKEFNRISILLTVVEYLEVLIEVSASQIWGERGRWAVVTIIQLLKVIWRAMLLIRNRASLILSPPIKPVDRTKSLTENKDKMFMNGIGTTGFSRLPRSGRLIRTLEGTPPPHLRTFALPPVNCIDVKKMKSGNSLTTNQLVAEILHIFRPIGHLSSMYLFGVKSWVPWCMAFGIDLTSLHLHSQALLTDEEKEELLKRRLKLLYYLIRTPAFHAVTQKRINQFLIAAGNNVPLARFICQPLLEYVPEWQKIYSYTWS